jgi:hypothetical protein
MNPETDAERSEVTPRSETGSSLCPRFAAAIKSQFGSGIVTFSPPWLFRTPPGWDLYVKGPSNRWKVNCVPLEGIVETWWLNYTFTLNWITGDLSEKEIQWGGFFRERPGRDWECPHCAKWHGAANHAAKEVRDSWHQCRIVPPRRELPRLGGWRARAASDGCQEAGWHYSPFTWSASMPEDRPQPSSARGRTRRSRPIRPSCCGFRSSGRRCERPPRR